MHIHSAEIPASFRWWRCATALWVVAQIVGCSGEEASDGPGNTIDAAVSGIDTTLNFFGQTDSGDGDSIGTEGKAPPPLAAPEDAGSATDLSPQTDAEATTEFVCTPFCEDRECGPNGCGGECGVCGEYELCSNAGECYPDPQAGCAGLSLAEDWVGTFDGTYSVGAFGLFSAAEGDTDGDISFSLKCFNSKLIISGKATGLASGENPFELDLAGYFYPETNEFDGQVPSGTLELKSVAGTVELEGAIPGSLQADGTLSGSYNVTATKITMPIIGEVDPATVPASSAGTWTASPAP